MTPRSSRAPLRTSRGATSPGGVKYPNKPHRVEPLPGWKPVTSQNPRKHTALIVVVVGIVLVAITGKFLLSFVASHGVHYERERLKARTVAVAKVLDVDSLRLLTGRTEDAQTTAFKALVTPLREARRANSDIRFIYLMGRKNSTIVFLVDATDESSSDYSSPGEVYEEATTELISLFSTGDPFVEGPMTDRWGTWVSGLAPIKDPSSGRVIAVLGMDVDATRWRVTLGVCRTLTYVFLAGLVGLVVFLARRFRALT